MEFVVIVKSVTAGTFVMVKVTGPPTPPGVLTVRFAVPDVSGAITNVAMI
jgi:hypothetical protein